MNGMEIIFIFQKKESKMQIDKVQTQCKSIIEETSSEVCYTSFADYSLLTFDSGRREHEKEVTIRVHFVTYISRSDRLNWFFRLFTKPYSFSIWKEAIGFAINCHIAFCKYRILQRNQTIHSKLANLEAWLDSERMIVLTTANYPESRKWNRETLGGFPTFRENRIFILTSCSLFSNQLFSKSDLCIMVLKYFLTYFGSYNLKL